MKRFVPAGMRILCYVYLVNAILFLFSIALFHSQIFVLGIQLSSLFSWMVRVLLIALPLYLFFQLKRLNKAAWLAAVIYHVFFFLNDLTALGEHEGIMHSLIRISGPYSAAAFSGTQVLLFVVHALFNLLIVAYLAQRSAYFSLQK